MEEKRLHKRTDLNSKLHLQLIETNNGRQLEPFVVDITDVSSEGIGFACDEQLMIGEVFHGELELWTKQKVTVILKVVRSAVEEVGYSYGCIFVGMRDADSLHIKIYQMLDEV